MPGSSRNGQDRRRRRVIASPDPAPPLAPLAELRVAGRVRDRPRLSHRRAQQQRSALESPRPRSAHMPCRNPRTSSAPSLNPMPRRSSDRQRDAGRRQARPVSSPSRHLSATIRDGRRQNLSRAAACSSAGTFTGMPPPKRHQLPPAGDTRRRDHRLRPSARARQVLGSPGNAAKTGQGARPRPIGRRWRTLGSSWFPGRRPRRPLRPSRPTPSIPSATDSAETRSVETAASSVPRFSRQRLKSGQQGRVLAALVRASVSDRRQQVGHMPASSGFAFAHVRFREISDHRGGPRGIAHSRLRQRASWQTSVPASAGRVPSATKARMRLLAGCRTASAATMRSPVDSGHCAGSSASTRHRREAVRPPRIGADAAHPCARQRDPRSRACCAVSHTFHRRLILELVAHERQDMLEGDPGLLERSKPRSRFRPAARRAAHPGSPPRSRTSSAVLPLPRATDSAADWTPGANAPRINRRCQGRTVNACPARRPCETVRPDR